MKFSKFKEYVDLLSKLNQEGHQIYKLGANLMEREESYQTLLSILWKNILTDDGIRWLEWFLYDKGAINGSIRDDIKAWDAEKNEICKDLKGLHKYLKKSGYFKI
jgi:hypothetical protein